MSEPSALNGAACKTILTKRTPTSRYFTKRETSDIRSPKMNRALRMRNSCLSSGEVINVRLIVIVTYCRNVLEQRGARGPTWACCGVVLGELSLRH
jgi:hypothetical protein